MSGTSGFPAMIGKVGRRPVSALAERALEFAPKKRPICVLMDQGGQIWLDRPEDANVREIIGTYRHNSDPDDLAEDIRFEARARGML